MTDPDELPSDAVLGHAYCRCPLLPIEEDTVPKTDDAPAIARRARVILACEAGGCGATYTYLTREHVAFTQDVQMQDVLEARAAAAGWGWTGSTEPDQRDDRCPRHPADEHLLDGGD